MWKKIRDFIQFGIFSVTMVLGFWLIYLYLWMLCGFPFIMTWAYIVAFWLAIASAIGWTLWVKKSKR